MNWPLIGALFGLIGVAAGAVGGHGLKSAFSVDRFEAFAGAVCNQMYHAITLVLAGMLHADRAPWCFFLGIIIFSGSLYLLVLLEQRWLGAITPIGGLLLIGGWLLLAPRGQSIA